MNNEFNGYNFDENIKKLENFLIENKKLPDVETDQPLSQWMIGQRRDSNPKKENRDKVLYLLEKYGLKNKRVGKPNKSFEEIYNLLENYIKENNTDEISKEDSQEYYGLDIKSWLAQRRTSKDNRIILEKLYNKYNLEIIKREPSFTEDFKNILFFSYKYKIQPYSLYFIYSNERNNYPEWLRSFKRNLKENRINKDFHNEIINNKLDEKINYEYFFQIEILKIFFNINLNIDLEITDKVCLVLNKYKNDDFISYKVETKKITKKIKKINTKDFIESDFFIYYEIIPILNKLRCEKDKLNEKDKLFLEKFDKINTKLNNTKKKIKNILRKRVKSLFCYCDYEDFVNYVYKDSVMESKIGGIDYNLLCDLNLNQTYIAEKSNLSRERSRQIISVILKEFDIRLNDKICMIDLKKEEKKIIINRENKMEKNIIYYGAPGTGKSNIVAKKIKDEEKYICMFHEEYTYFDFLGQYRPVMYTINNHQKTNVFNEINEEVELYKDKSPIIVYNFIAGIFLKAYIAAKKSKNNIFLLIEEINRGDCASIFGDIFQLLDRNENGESKYSINTSNEVSGFLKKEGIENYYEIRLPSNLYITATMNTSDQSLFNMDSAFKRRWDMEFVPINYNENNFIIENSNIYWCEILENINKLIIAVLESENKCLGQWFIKSDNNIIKENQFKNKVLHYLYFDVFHNDRELVFDSFEYSKVISLKIEDFNKRIIEVYNKKIQGD